MIRSAKHNSLRSAGSIVLAVCFLLSSCIDQKEQRLPIYGEKEVVNNDTVYHTIGNFRLVNQDSATVTNETLDGKIYVADFFFTSCRTICPIMKTQMMRVYDAVEDDPDVA